MAKFNPNEHFMDLKGKKYLQVMWRLVWFREDHPDWCINTELVSHDPEKGTAVFKAEIMEPKTEHAVSTGYGSESVKDFRDYLEKAETKAIGRALAILGYGTQFAPEFDEGERLADSPVQMGKASIPASKAAPKNATAEYYKKCEAAKKDGELICKKCGSTITAAAISGQVRTAQQIAEVSTKRFGSCLCGKCYQVEMLKNKEAADESHGE